MSDENIKNKIFEVIALTFNVGLETLSESVTAEDIDGWDSLAHATLLIRIEKKLNVNLDMQKASYAQNIGELIVVCNQALVGEL